MDPETSRTLLLAVPSAIGLALLVAHGFRHRSRQVMLSFLLASFAFGILRGNAVYWLAVRSSVALGNPTGFGLMPYLMRSPLVHLGHASLQECVGWTFALYLGWCLAEGILSRRAERAEPLVTVALVGLFLACVSYAVEAAAGALGWWRWTVPVTSRYLLAVPPVGLLDWSSVAVDIFLPFLLWQHRDCFAAWARWASLLLFPAHMATHLLDVVAGERRLDTLVLPSDMAHWAMVLSLVAVALASRTTAAAPAEATAAAGSPHRSRFLPHTVALMLLSVVWTALGPVAGRWDLCPAAGALGVFILLSIPALPLWAAGLAAAALAPLGEWRGLAAAVCFGLGAGPLLLGAWRGTRPARVVALLVWVAGGSVIAAHAFAVRRVERAYARALTEEAASPSPAAVAASANALRRALAIHPSPVVLQMRVATSLGRLGMAELAAEQYRLALEREPDLVWARTQLGQLLTTTGRFPEAIAELERAVRLDPTSYQLHHNLGLAQLGAGRLEEARRCFQRALDLAPADDPLPSLGLARVEVAAGHPEAAKELLGRVVEGPSQRPEIYCELAALELRGGETALAEVHCRRAIAQDPRCSPAHRLLALALSTRPEGLVEARAEAQRAVALSEDALALDALGVVLIRSGERAEARQVLLRALRRCTSAEVCTAIQAHLEAAGQLAPR